MIIQSHKGNHSLSFDEEKHVYTLNGELVPGATDVGRALPKGYNIEQWDKGNTAKYVVDYFQKRMNTTDLWPTQKEIDEVIKQAKNASKVILDQTADIGTFTHDYCHSKRLGKQFDDSKVRGHKDEEQIRKRFAEADKWIAERERTENIIMAEQIIASPKHRFAGKFDVLVERKGKIVLQDYKSAKGFYMSQFIQEGGYSTALMEWYDIKVDEFEVIRFNDNTPEPASLVLDKPEHLRAFEQAFIGLRYTREFMREWEPFFEKLYRKGQPKRVNKRAKKAS